MSRELKLKPEVLAHALRIAEAVGYTNVTRQAVAEASGVSTGMVSKYFGTMQGLRRAIMSSATHNQNFIVLAQGLAAKDAKAMGAPAWMKTIAAGTLV